MQLSMDPRYPGYQPDGWELDITVWLDGVQQRRAIALDTDAGTLVVSSPDHGYIMTTGHVEVRCGQTGKVLAATPTKETKADDNSKPNPARADATRGGRGQRSGGKWR